MYLRVINGSDKIDYLLASGAYVPSGNAVVGAIDLQTDDEPELFVTTQGGSHGSPRNVLLFQIEDCELVPIKRHGTDFNFSLSVGYWSAGGHSYGIDCVGGAPVLKNSTLTRCLLQHLLSLHGCGLGLLMNYYLIIQWKKSLSQMNFQGVRFHGAKASIVVFSNRSFLIGT